MKLEEVLALHPKRADAAMLREAIAKAEGLRVDLLTRAATLERTRSEGLLTLDEKAMLRAEEDAAKARLAADRIAALLPDMRADLYQAEGREALAALQAQVPAVVAAIEALEAWKRDDFPKIPPIVRVGFDLEDAAISARQHLLDNIAAAYGRQEVRDQGALDIIVPPLPDGRPRSLFFGWR